MSAATEAPPRYVAREERIAELEAALKDIAMGADMMLQPGMHLPAGFANYAREVKRVALAAVNAEVSA